MKWNELSKGEQMAILRRKRTVAKRRAHLEMTQAQLADLVDRARENISRIECGRIDPGEDLAQALSEALKAPLEKLLPDIYYRETGKLPEHLEWLMEMNFEREVLLKCQGF